MDEKKDSCCSTDKKAVCGCTDLKKYLVGAFVGAALVVVALAIAKGGACPMGKQCPMMQNK